MPSFAVQTYTSAVTALDCLRPVLESNELAANVILPTLLKSSALEMRSKPVENQYWIVHTTNSKIDFVVSCTEGAVGKYPIFIFTTTSYHQLTQPDYLLPRMKNIVQEVRRSIPLRRVYSVFAQRPVSEAFVELWTQSTGIAPVPEPYYESWMSYCTADTFVPHSTSKESSVSYEMRPADKSDVEQTAELCRLFAADCPPFIMDRTMARKEADTLIKNGQLWVCRAKKDGSSHIASICAMTRNSENVATITKVFTNPDFRRQGCAERLVRRVCEYLFRRQNKKAIVLYVGTDNSARFVYSKVGFAGLLDNEPRPAGVDQWVEFGFDQSQVELGHW